MPVDENGHWVDDIVLEVEPEVEEDTAPTMDNGYDEMVEAVQAARALNQQRNVSTRAARTTTGSTAYQRFMQLRGNLTDDDIRHRDEQSDIQIASGALRGELRPSSQRVAAVPTRRNRGSTSPTKRAKGTSGPQYNRIRSTSTL